MDKRPIFLIIALLLASTALAQAYRWVDEDGVVHYGDRPPPDAETTAEAIVLPEANVTSVRTYERPAAESSSSDDANETAGAFRYESLEIASPAAEETLWNIAIFTTCRPRKKRSSSWSPFRSMRPLVHSMKIAMSLRLAMSFPTT